MLTFLSKLIAHNFDLKKMSDSVTRGRIMVGLTIVMTRYHDGYLLYGICKK